MFQSLITIRFAKSLLVTSEPPAPAIFDRVHPFAFQVDYLFSKQSAVIEEILGVAKVFDLDPGALTRHNLPSQSDEGIRL